MADMAMPGMMTPPQGDIVAEQMTPENLAAFEQMRQEIPAPEFNEQLLSASSEADPMAVAEFKSELRGLELPEEVLAVLDQMTDEVLADPANYDQIRAKYMAQDIPEDLLPPVFDPEFFGALNLAVDEIRATSGMPRAPMGFAHGGLASLNPIAAGMAQAGRYGDTMLAHVSPREISALRQMGGSGTINPETGFPEFFLKKLFRGVGKVFKKIGSAVKKFAQSSVGKIVTTLALAFFLGPAAATALGVSSTAGVAAMSGFVGSAGSTLAAGGNFKEALKSGAIGGITGGALAGVSGGADAFKAGSYTGPTTIGGQVQKAKAFFSPSRVGGPAPVTSATPAPITPPTAFDSASARGTFNVNAPFDPAQYPPSTSFNTPPTAFDSASARGTFNLNSTFDPAQYPPSTPINTPLTAFESASARGKFNLPSTQTGPQGQSALSGDYGFPQIDARDVAKLTAAPPAPPAVTPTAGTPTAGTPTAGTGIVSLPKPSSFWENLKGSVTKDTYGVGGTDLGFLEGIKGALSPTEVANRIRYGKLENLAKTQGFTTVDAMQKAAMQAGANPSLLETITKIGATDPSPFRTYAPLALAGLGIMGATGGFKESDVQAPLGIANMPTGSDLLRRYPEQYRVNLGPSYTSYSGAAAPRRAATGGQMDKEFPRKTGPINGPGTGTSDDIPAMLSDGEFVFTAKSVRNLGDGSRRKGAKRMYAMMKNLENKNHG